MGAEQHLIEYAKSGRAKCHGRCGGALIPRGSLRYGRKIVSDQYGESTIWWHWECAEKYLAQLASVHLDHIPGFHSLRSDDKNRVREDVKARRIASTASLAQSSDIGGSRKRKAEAAPAQSSTQSSEISKEDFDEYSDEREDEVKDELYVSLPTSVVGLQYYHGMVGPGEEVTLVREPHNPHDNNAIQVLNISGMQVGHIPRTIATKVAPLIDRNYVTLEGVIHEGNANGFEYSISMTLKIYGASNNRAELEPMLIWATPRQKGFTSAMRPANYQAQALASSSHYSHSMGPPVTGQGGSSRLHPATGISATKQKTREDQAEALRKAAELRSILNSLEKVDDEGRRTSFLDTVCTVDDVLDLPLHPCPPSVETGDLTVNLLRHQSQALQWCLNRENPSLPVKESDKPVQFWQYKKSPGKPQGYYLNIATKTPQEAPPVLGRGGLMADAMGLGKTLTMLALVISSKNDVPKDHANTTLIVVPLSVLSNWKTQISELCASSLSTFVYYDTGRNFPSDHLKTFDIVITTYQVVAQDFNLFNGTKTQVDLDGKHKKKRSCGGLFDVKWKRIILDEGHSVRNPKTKMATAVRNLEAHRRWVVTGTPIINSPKDLGSLLQFLRLPSPLDKEDFYKRLLLRPLAQGAPEGAELLRALMSQICIRRTKEMQNSKGEHLVPLPPVEMTVIPVQLDAETRALYDEIEALSKQRVANYVERQGTPGGLNVPTNVLSLLTRLRQLTLHPGLLPLDYSDQLRSMTEESEKPAIHITPQDKVRLQSALLQSIEDSYECPICFSIPFEPRITACAHVFCLPCISEVVTRDPRCPMDRRMITIKDLIEPPPPTDFTQIAIREEVQKETTGIRAGSSAKVDQLIYLLRLTPKTEKSLVFSQFTAFLDKIAEALEDNGIPYVRFDGQMSARKRQEVLETFSVPLTENSPAHGKVLRSKRTRRSATSIVEDDDGLDVEDGEFIMDAQCDDESTLDDSDDVNPWVNKKDKGKGKSKDIHTVYGENPVVMLISLKAGALGLNLTVANNVYLMDPWWQEGIESQAIDRCNRIGQTKPVHVYQLVAEDTVEAKVLDIQERKKALIKQAFSGMKSVETQRQKKEARLQDLVELFGIRRNALGQNVVA